MNDPNFIQAWNAARAQIRLQAQNIETAWRNAGWPIDGFALWWDVFLGT